MFHVILLRNPTITLRVYGHLFNNTDERAATIMEAAFAKV
jgi:hypothetical protein